MFSLRYFPALSDKNFILINDIDLDPNLRGEAAFEQAVLPRFSGTFDGNGLEINNLTLTGFAHLGLIGTLEEGGVVQNLGVVDANITGQEDHIGILVSYNHGTVSNSYSTGIWGTCSNPGTFSHALWVASIQEGRNGMK